MRRWTRNNKKLITVIANLFGCTYMLCSPRRSRIPYQKLPNDIRFFKIQLLDSLNYLFPTGSNLSYAFQNFAFSEESTLWLLDNSVRFSSTTTYNLPIPVSARSKAWVCGHQVDGNAGSNPDSRVDVCVLCRYRSLRRVDHSPRGVLPTVVRLIVVSKYQQWGVTDPIELSSHEKKSQNKST